MITTDPDKHWERFGKQDPYFGAVSYDRFRRENLNEQTKSEFFQSGENHIDFIVKAIRQHLDADFNPGRCLDFGCGVGRLVIPMARRFKEVVGVDISKSMLQEARQNCQEYDIENVAFVESDDELSKLDGKFDFIHSLIVFQHIPVQRGVKLLEQMIELLNEGGVAALHFTYFRNASLMKKIMSWIPKKMPLTDNLVNLIKGRRFNHPRMQMNTYNLNRIFALLQNQGYNHVYVRLQKVGKFLSLILFFQKKKA